MKYPVSSIWNKLSPSILVCIILMIIGLTSIGSAFAQSAKTFIPEKANPLIPQVHAATESIMPGFNRAHFFSSQIEHESCISLTHRRCLEPTSELKTHREQGVGLGQITRTFRVDGTVRFDTLTDLRIRYPQHLRGLSWDNVKHRPDLQIKAVVVLYNESYRSFNMVKSIPDRMAMSAAAYNGGARDIHKSRRLCGLAKDCDPQYWFNNTEKYCVKSKAILYGNRSACDINVHYPRDVMGVRMPKYEKRYTQLGYYVEPVSLSLTH